MNHRIVVLAGSTVVGIGAFANSTVLATPVQFGSGGGTYTYNTDSGGTTATAGDSNANLHSGETTFFNEALTQAGNEGTYYIPTGYNLPEQLSYTFNAAPGEVFATGSTAARFNVYYYNTINGTVSGSITESITTSVISTPLAVDAQYDNGSSYDTNSLTADIAGSTSFTLTFSLYSNQNENLPNFYIQLFREDPPQDGGSDLYPFVVTTTSVPGLVPEPASLGLLGLGTLASLFRRRRA